MANITHCESQSQSIWLFYDLRRTCLWHDEFEVRICGLHRIKRILLRKGGGVTSRGVRLPKGDGEEYLNRLTNIITF